MNRLHRPLTVLELLQIQKMFSYNRGYKDLIRDFKHDFNVELDKQTAKQFLKNRSWSEVLYWLTGDKIVPPDAEDEIKVVERKKYELLELMVKANKVDEQERTKEINEFNNNNYYFPECVKYFNFPLYGEIITYKFKEPFLKCFLLDNNGKITKIQDVPVSEELPIFLLSVIRKINDSKILTTKTITERLADNINTPYYVNEEEVKQLELKNIFDSELFKHYNFSFKQ